MRIKLPRPLSRRFRRLPFQVVVADVNEETGRETVQGIITAGGRALFAKTDVTDEGSVAACMSSAKDHFGGLHILVNNACSFTFGHLKYAARRGHVCFGLRPCLRRPHPRT